MKIYLLRHGETTGDIEDRYGGDYDDSLSEEGRVQARELAVKLRGKGIEKVFHSPRKRAKETATFIAVELKVPLLENADIRERNAYGVLTGMIKAEARKVYPEEVLKLENDKINHSVEGSERYTLFKERVLRAMDKVLEVKHEVIAVVTHGGPISCYVREVLQLGEFAHLGDCAILELEKDEKKVRLVSMKNAEIES